MAEPPALLLLARPGCGLCEEMEQALREHAAAQASALDHADVDARPEWLRRYGLRIPVLLDAWGEVICEGRFDAEAFDHHLRELRLRAAR